MEGRGNRIGRELDERGSECCRHRGTFPLFVPVPDSDDAKNPCPNTYFSANFNAAFYPAPLDVLPPSLSDSPSPSDSLRRHELQGFHLNFSSASPALFLSLSLGGSTREAPLAFAPHYPSTGTTPAHLACPSFLPNKKLYPPLPVRHGFPKTAFLRFCHGKRANY